MQWVNKVCCDWIIFCRQMSCTLNIFPMFVNWPLFGKVFKDLCLDWCFKTHLEEESSTLKISMHAMQEFQTVIAQSKIPFDSIALLDSVQFLGHPCVGRGVVSLVLLFFVTMTCMAQFGKELICNSLFCSCSTHCHLSTLWHICHTRPIALPPNIPTAHNRNTSIIQRQNA